MNVLLIKAIDDNEPDYVVNAMNFEIKNKQKTLNNSHLHIDRKRNRNQEV